ncbi:DUF1622 domain-containing protein [Candidatus Allofournierella merdavium]|uniref:DUF1622 domain-containing protein n=1 Tax=Candidatus Allofournierella merdavium TaxID=2838593 RepID=UPI00374EDB15
MEPIASMAPAATPAPPAPLSGAEAMFFENFYNGLHEGLVTLVNLSVVLLEFIGVGVIVVAALQGIYNYVRRDPLTRLKLAKGMAMGLEFKLGSEILRTVVVRQFSEIAIVGAIIVLRAALTFLIHWEIKTEEAQMEQELEQKQALIQGGEETADRQQE